VLVVAVFWAPLIQKFDSLVSYYQEIVSYLAPPVVGTFFIGLFWKRSNEKGALWGLISGLIIAFVLMAAKYLAGIAIPLHFLMLAPMIMALSILVNVLVSLAGHVPDPDKVQKNTWTVQVWRDESRELKGVVWYKNFRVLSLLLVLACFALYVYFR
jgi:SSS family solute:Na+ symporter